MEKGNLFAHIPPNFTDEILETLLATKYLKLERIIPAGHATARGGWYNQNFDEWVILLKGSACLFFDGETEPIELQPGDYLHIPAHAKHRVEWTDSEQKTVWLALRFTQD